MDGRRGAIADLLLQLEFSEMLNTPMFNRYFPEPVNRSDFLKAVSRVSNA